MDAGTQPPRSPVQPPPPGGMCDQRGQGQEEAGWGVPAKLQLPGTKIRSLFYFVLFLGV